MSALDRNMRLRRKCRPPERHRRSSTTRQIHQPIPILLLLLYLAMGQFFVAAQTATSTVSVAEPTQTLSVIAIPSLINLPALNSTRPAIQLSFPASRDLFLTFNLCSLTSNTSLVPTVLISTSSDTVWTLGPRPITDATSGGTREGGYNRRSRAGGLWSLTWDKGFGNWTIERQEGGSVVKVLIDLAMGSDGTARPVSGAGNVGVQLGVSSSSKSSPLNR